MKREAFIMAHGPLIVNYDQRSLQRQDSVR